MNRRDFLASTAAVAVLCATDTADGQTNPREFVVTRYAQGVAVKPEMFGGNVLAPSQVLDPGEGDNGIDVGHLQDLAGITGILRWPGGSLTEGNREICDTCTSGPKGNWLPYTGVDFGDFPWTQEIRDKFVNANGDYQPLAPTTPRPAPGSFRGIWANAVPATATTPARPARLEFRFLKTTLEDFLGYLHAHTHVKGAIVLPTHRFLWPRPTSRTDRVKYGALNGMVQNMVNHVYGRIANGGMSNAKIFAWEIGNEYQGGEAPSGEHVMTAAEYGRIAETAVRVVRITRPTAKVSIQGGSLWADVGQANSNFRNQVTELRTAFNLRANYYNTLAPDYLSLHTYSTTEYGHSAHGARLAHVREVWGPIPIFVSEWNLQQAEESSSYSLSTDTYRLGMERSWRLTSLFQALIDNGAEAACFWPVVQGAESGLSSFDNVPVRHISGELFKWLTEVKGMRTATVTGGWLAGDTGNLVKVRAYCGFDTDEVAIRNKAIIFVHARNTSAQTIRIKVMNMPNRTPQVSMQRISGASGPMTLPASFHVPYAVESNIGITSTGITGGRLLTLAIRNNPGHQPYEVLKITANFA